MTKTWYLEHKMHSDFRMIVFLQLVGYGGKVTSFLMPNFKVVFLRKIIISLG